MINVLLSVNSHSHVSLVQCEKTRHYLATKFFIQFPKYKLKHDKDNISMTKITPLASHHIRNVKQQTYK